VATARFPTVFSGSDHRSWVDNFLRRYPNTLKRTPVKRGKILIDNEDQRSALTTFVDALEHYIRTYSLLPADILNIDETRSELARQSVPIHSALTTQQHTLAIDYMKESECKSVVVATDGAGFVLSILFISRSRKGGNPEMSRANLVTGEALEKESNVHSVLSATTTSGMMTFKLWLSFIDHVKNVALQLSSKPKLLLFDSSSTHKHDSLNDDYFMSLQIPPGMTLFLQPLDNIPFALYKQALKRNMVSPEPRSAGRRRPSLKFSYDIERACKEAFTTEVRENRLRIQASCPLTRT